MAAHGITINSSQIHNLQQPLPVASNTQICNHHLHKSNPVTTTTKYTTTMATIKITTKLQTARAFAIHHHHGQRG
jgi:hypothetical protein